MIEYLARLTLAIIIAVVAVAITVGILFVLPPYVSLGVMFVGLALFCIGAQAGYKWPAAVGGVLMFAGMFTAALLGALN
jgi:hypothetical protein